MPEAAPSKNQIVLFICLVMFLDALGFGLILPIMPALIDELSELNNSAGATVAGYLLLTFAAMQFLFAPILGGLSDRYGRRLVLLGSLLGYALDYFIMALAPSLLFLFVARMVSGVFGATFAAANACITDISTVAERAKFFGFTSASVGLGFVFGPVLGGALGEINVRLPFIAAGILVLSVFVYGWFYLPETLKPANRRAFSIARANPIGSLISVSRYRVVFTIMAAVFCIQLANQSYSSIWPFYVIEITGWSELLIGLTVGFYGMLLVIVQGGLIGPVTQRFGHVKPVYFSVISGVVSFMILAFAASGWGIYIGILVGALAGFAFPAMQTLMTARAPENAQGELQGAIMSLYSISAIIGPIVMALIFSAHTDETGLYMPGAPFILAAGLIVLSLITFTVAIRLSKGEATAEPEMARSD
ncbi:MAG: TCR/Tet family MFS transporter [Pseudomonadota bacterium]